MMGMTVIIMMDFALRQMPSFFWAFFAIHRTHGWNKTTAKFSASAIQRFHDLCGGAETGRKRYRGWRWDQTDLFFPRWHEGWKESFSGIISILPLNLSQSKNFLLFSFQFWGFDNVDNISRQHWHIFCLRNIVEKITTKFIMYLNSQNQNNW